jgi:DNA-binding MarR family transcriptional regulator
MTTARKTSKRVKNENPFADDRLSPSAALLAAQVALDRALERHASSTLGLDSYTADLLVQLMRAPEHRLRGVDLARQLLITTSRTSRLIDRAEAAGLVERRPDPNDRRAQQVAITARGEQLALEFAPYLLAVLDRVFVEQFTSAELKTLTRLLTRVRDAARDVAALEAV